MNVVTCKSCRGNLQDSVMTRPAHRRQESGAAFVDPPHDDLVFSSGVQPENRGPLAAKRRDVLLFFCRVSNRTSPSSIDAMLCRQAHAVAAERGAVLQDVLTSEVVVLLEGKTGVEPYGGGRLGHEEIAQDKGLQ